MESSSATTPGTVGEVACVGLDVAFTDLPANGRLEKKEKDFLARMMSVAKERLWLSSSWCRG